MRTSNSIKNSLTGMLGNIISLFIAFVAQAIFIRILGAEFLGLNGLFTNILTMLSIFELGIGNAIVYNLYKPIEKKEIDKINSLMTLYKKAYNIIALLIFIFGISMIPLLKYIIGEINIEINIYYVYMLFLLSTISSYLMTYKRNLIIANQKNYIINLIHIFYLIILNITQLIIIYLTKNYYYYLIVKIICQLLENIVISKYASRKYKYLNTNSKSKLDKTTEKDIISRVKALFFHKIGAIVVNGTDNIIISKLFGIITVGLYTNYNTIINAVNIVFSQVISSTTASIGNLLISNDNQKKIEIFEKLRFLNTWISIFTATSLLVIIQPFISIWVGNDYKLEFSVLLVIIFNFFQKMQRQTYSTFKDSAGIWREDKYIPIIESILNIIFSLVLAKKIGLMGVFIGTIISGLVLWCYSYPKYIYKSLLGKSYLNYAKETISYILLFIIISVITYFVAYMIQTNNIYLRLIINIIVSLMLPNFIMYTIYRKNDNFLYYKNIIKKIIKNK